MKELSVDDKEGSIATAAGSDVPEKFDADIAIKERIE
jgi:hypothetical protein